MSFNIRHALSETIVIVVALIVVGTLIFDFTSGYSSNKHEVGTVVQITPEFNDHSYDYHVQIKGDNNVVYKTTYYTNNLPIIGQKVNVEYISSNNFLFNNRVVSVN